MNNEAITLYDGVVCWKIVFRLSVQKTIRMLGGFIDPYHNLDDIKRWGRHPETYPRRFRKRTVFFWKTYDDRPGFFRIWAVSWDNKTKTVLPYPFRLDGLKIAEID